MQDTQGLRTIPRTKAIELIRAALLQLTDDEHSMCAVAKKLGIGCTGFDQDSDEELRARYDWLAERRPGISREELERLANLWQVARQQLHGVPLSCDNQTMEHDTCMGWDGWENEALELLHEEVCKEQIKVVDDPQD